MLVCGAPVANREWALPHWFECLASQTVRPDRLIFVHSGQWGDETWQALFTGAEQHGFDLDVLHDPRAPHQRIDNARYQTLADLRNQLLTAAQDARADQFLSLDTDVMLEQPDTIEHLQTMLTDCDLASCATFLHPAASKPDVEHEIFWAYNAGWLPKDLTAHGFIRPLPNELDWDATHRIDIPMAIWLGNQQALYCRYAWHESGEDIAFGRALQAAGLICHWDPRVRAKHYWQPSHLKVAA